MDVDPGWNSLGHVWKEPSPDSCRHVLLTLNMLNVSLEQPLLNTLLTVSPFKWEISAIQSHRMGAGEENSKMISVPSVKILHNTCVTCHASPVHEENSSLIYSVAESCRKAIPTQTYCAEGVCVPHPRECCEHRSSAAPWGTPEKDPVGQNILGGILRIIFMVASFLYWGLKLISEV